MTPPLKLDELALEALTAAPADEAQFVRFSAPYERVEIEPSASASIRRVGVSRKKRRTEAPAPVERPSAPLALHKAWFEQPDDALAAIEESSIEPSSSWWWLVISLAVAAAALTFV